MRLQGRPELWQELALDRWLKMPFLKSAAVYCDRGGPEKSGQ
ncbi:hypothetical protein [Streptomyces sp. NPDC006446]